MAHSYSVCPICSNTIQEYQQDCDRCGWILETQNLLSPKIYDSLLEWAVRHY